MKTIILDIETTGDNYLIDEICQMSYIILDDNFKVISCKNFFFKVDYVYFKSNKKKLNIEGLKLLSDDKRFKDRYYEIFNDLNDSLIIGHNLKHDIDFIKSEFTRVNNKKVLKYKGFCTMEYYTDFLRIPSKKYGYKYPRLIEIMPYLNIKRVDINKKVQELFGLNEDEIEFHDSRVDVVSTYLIAKNTQDSIVESKLKIDVNKDKIKYNNHDVTIDYNISLNSKSELEDNIIQNEIYSSEISNKHSNDYIDIETYNNTISRSINTNLRDKYISYKHKIELYLKKLFSFRGCIGRREYLRRKIALIFTCIVSIDVLNTYTSFSNNGIELITSLIVLVCLIINLSIIVKRLHDINKSSWWIIALIVPIVNIVIGIELFLKKGIQNNNYDSNKINYKKYIKTKKFAPIILTLIFILVIINIDKHREKQAIDIVKNGPCTINEYELDFNTIEEYMNFVVDEVSPDVVYGWNAEKIGKNKYIVKFEFEDYEDGYNVYKYEVDIKSKAVWREV